MKQLFSSSHDELTRRAFAATMAKGLLGLTFSSTLLSAAGSKKAKTALVEGKAKRVIYLYMQGGMSHIDTLDPKPGTEAQGPTETVKTSESGIILASHFAKTAPLMSNCALIHSLTSKEGAHERARYQLHTGYPPLSSVQHPSLGSWVVKYKPRMNPDLPPYFAVGDMAFTSGFFENDTDPFRVGDPDSAMTNVIPPKYVPAETVERRISLMKDFNQMFSERFGKVEAVRDYDTFYDRALGMMKSKDLEALDLTKEDPSVRERYGKNRFGQACLLARRLAEHGVRYTEITWGQWDTHQENFDKVGTQATILDQGLSALIQDLKSNGLLQDTLIVLTSEFGRTPRINEGQGRDHHPDCFSALLAGGAIKGGTVYGSSDDEGRKVKDNPVTMMDLNATIVTALGLDPEKEVISPAGRPFTMAADGTPISALLS